MKYMGSKNRIAKNILPIILKDRKDNQYYVEPFVGGANSIAKVDGLRIGADINEYNICLFKAIQNGFIPPNEVNEVEYKDARINKKVDPITSFIGYGCSYSGKWFGGYARGNNTKGEPRNYCLESKNNIMKQKDGIIGVEFINCSYLDLEIPPKSIIYCDPPYKGTTSYRDSFNHDVFYDWVRDMKEKGHTIFVSEYDMPSDFTCLWSKEVSSSLTQDTGSKKNIERLFTL